MLSAAMGCLATPVVALQLGVLEHDLPLLGLDLVSLGPVFRPATYGCFVDVGPAHGV